MNKRLVLMLLLAGVPLPGTGSSPSSDTPAADAAASEQKAAVSSSNPEVSESAQLPAQDKKAILEMLCSKHDDMLFRDEEFECVGSGFHGNADPLVFSEFEWAWTMKGKFYAQDDEWLVFLENLQYRNRHSFAHAIVVRKVDGQWSILLDEGRYDGSECVPIRGMPDGFDRVACLNWSRGNPKSSSEWLAVHTFANGLAGSQTLLEKDQDDECGLTEPPAKATYEADDLDELSAADAGSETAFSVTLEVRRMEGCDSTTEDPYELATTKGTFTLRFVKRGNKVLPDPETALLVSQYGWAPKN